jgi:tRNA(Ile)-lysidine synthase
VVDPSNRDVRFTRPRFRALMPALASEGCDSRNLARLASRLARANAALEVLVDGAERFLALKDRDPRTDKGSWVKSPWVKGFDARGCEVKGFDAKAFAALSEEIRLRLLLRIINRVGHEGPAELGKVEALLSALDRAAGENAAKGRAKGRVRLKQTLAGALVSLTEDRIRIEPAPPRRNRANQGSRSAPKAARMP